MRTRALTARIEALERLGRRWRPERRPDLSALTDDELARLEAWFWQHEGQPVDRWPLTAIEAAELERISRKLQ